MQPLRIVGILVFIAGIVLLILGISAMESFGSQVSKFFTGAPTDRAVWLTIGGVIGIFAGGAFAFWPARAAIR